MKNDIDLQKMTKRQLKKLINPVLVDNDRLIRKVLKKKARLDKEQEKYNNFLKEHVYKILDKVNEKQASKLQKYSIKTIDGKYKMQIVHKNYVRLNENAELAKGIIDEYINKHLGVVKGDSQKMITFLKNLFESKRKITLNSGVLRFINMKFNDSNLRKAQDLLKAAIESDKSNTYVNIYKKTEEGWKRITNAAEEEF